MQYFEELTQLELNEEENVNETRDLPETELEKEEEGIEATNKITLGKALNGDKISPE